MKSRTQIKQTNFPGRNDGRENLWSVFASARLSPCLAWLARLEKYASADTDVYLSLIPVPVPDDGAGEASPSASRDKPKNKQNKERKPNADLVNLQPHSKKLEDGISLSSQQKPLSQVARMGSLDKSMQYDCIGTLIYHLFHISFSNGRYLVMVYLITILTFACVVLFLAVVYVSRAT